MSRHSDINSNCPSISFPGQYHNPRRRDSHIAFASLDPHFLEFYTQALVYSDKYCTDPGCCPFLDNPEEHSVPSSARELHSTTAYQDGKSNIQSNDRVSSELQYPLSLLAHLGDLPPADVLNSLLNQFQTRFLPSMPFLCRIQPHSFVQKDAPPYLLITMALLGSMVSPELGHRSWSRTLWLAGVNILRVTVEVDNSLSRELDWQKATIFLITYGTFQANAEVWRETNTLCGYLQACLSGQEYGRSTGIAQDHAAKEKHKQGAVLMKFYFMIDTIRAVHFQNMTAFTSNRPMQMDHDQNDSFRTIYQLFVHDGRPLPSSITLDDHLLILIAILSDIHFLLLFLGPLATPDPSSLRAWPEHSSSGDFRSNSNLASSNPWDDFNPYLPFTAKSQYQNLRQALLVALNSLKPLIFEESSEEIEEQNPIRQRVLKPLMHFCYLLLYAGPAVYVVMSLSSYPLDGAKDVTSENHVAGKLQAAKLCANDDSIKEALELLEVLRSDTQQRRSGIPSAGPLIWDPLLVFFAGLVVQAGVIEEQESLRSQGRPSSSLLGSKALLGMFVAELNKLHQHWDMAKDMGDIISKC